MTTDKSSRPPPRPRAPVAFLAAAALLAAACSRSEPRIVYGFMELVYAPEGESFTFFVIPEDDEGLDNLAELYLYHDREGLRWTLTPEDWIIIEENDTTWVGSRNIRMNDGQSLPRGAYRAVLINKGGERSERTFAFDAPEPSRYPLPTLTVADGVYQLASEYPVNRFMCYDQTGAFLQTVTVEPGMGTVADLGLPGATRSVSLWAEDPEYQCAAVTDAIPTR